MRYAGNQQSRAKPLNRSTTNINNDLTECTFFVTIQLTSSGYQQAIFGFVSAITVSSACC